MTFFSFKCANVAIVEGLGNTNILQCCNSLMNYLKMRFLSMYLFIYFILEPAICQTFWKAANRYFMEVFNRGRYCMLYQIIF